jgi:molybdopterin molybdotransferase
MSERSSTGPVPVEEYLQRVLALVQPMEPFEHTLMDVLGLPVAQDLRAPLSLPVFDNSAMDGYAVAFRDVADATPERPLHLPVVGEIAAGQTTIFDLTPGTAVRIMTGAPVPQGCGAVVPFEWTSEEGPDDRREVVVRRAPEEGQHVRRAGEDIAEGEVLVRAGEVIGPRQLGLLAAAGFGRVPTAPRPRVVVMSTGTELVEPGRPLGRDSVYDANSYLLAAAVRTHGGVPYRVTATTDDPQEFADALSDQLVRADVVVTSGGVSKGTHDVVKEVLSELGTVDFLEVAMQPGKPQGLGVVGEDRTPIFTLPGNPVSAYVSFEMFVVPALHRLGGREPAARSLTTARLTEPVRSVRGRSQLLRARIDMDATGLRATPVGGAGSHLIGGLARSDALLVLAEDVTRADVGEQVPVLLLDLPT